METVDAKVGTMREAAKAIFNQIDVNNDNKITGGELTNAIVKALKSPDTIQEIKGFLETLVSDADTTNYGFVSPTELASAKTLLGIE